MKQNKKYKLELSKKAKEDLKEIIEYISFKLNNTIASENFLKDFYKRTTERLSNPTAFAKYRTSIDVKNTYYTILVKNYMVFYYVKSDTVIVQRILYSKRNFTKLI